MIKKLDFEKIIYILTIIFMIMIPSFKLLSYILYLSKIVKNIFVINEVYVLWIFDFIFFITYIIGLITKKYKISFADILMIFLFLFGIISTIFGVDFKTSLIGANTRYEGLLSLLNYYLIFLNIKNMKNERYKKNIIKVFIILGIINCTYGILQVFTRLPFIKRYSLRYMGMGLCGNPNFFGSYMLLLALIVIPLYLTNGNKKYLLLSICFIIGVILSETTGVFIALILSIIFMIIVFNKKIKIFRYILMIVLIFGVSFIVDVGNSYYHAKVFGIQIDSNYNIRFELKKITSIKSYKNGEVSTESFGNGRIKLWKKTIPYAKKYWLTGTGIDSFGLVFPPYDGLAFDKTHNVYLQMEVTNGLFALIMYCIICLIIFIKGFKFKDSFYIALYLSFIGYCIQSFANISVISVAPYFYIILGMLYSKIDDDL